MPTRPLAHDHGRTRRHVSRPRRPDGAACRVHGAGADLTATRRCGTLPPTAPGAALCLRCWCSEGAIGMTGGDTSAQPLKIGMYVPFSERQMQGETPRWADILALAR